MRFRSNPNPAAHLAPRPGFATVPCCGRAPHELPQGDRLVVDVSKVTCPGRAR